MRIYTYQQIEQRLIHTHKEEFHVLVAFFGTHKHKLEVLIDDIVTSVNDIERSLEKLTDPKIDRKFYNLYKMTSPADGKENIKQAMKRVDKMIQDKNSLESHVYHWVVISHNIRITSPDILKKFNVNSLTNLKLERNGTVIMTSLRSDGSSDIKYIKQGTI